MLPLLPQFRLLLPLLARLFNQLAHPQNLTLKVLLAPSLLMAHHPLFAQPLMALVLMLPRTLKALLATRMEEVSLSFG